MERETFIERLFVEEYPRLVRALAVAFDTQSAADAVQDAFIVADRRWRRVAALEDPAGWIRRVALNRLLNGRRNERRRREILESLPLDPSPGLDVDTVADLRAEVGRLPERMRVAVALHYLADLSIAEVAVAMGVAEGTVKSTLHDARARLRAATEEAAS